MRVRFTLRTLRRREFKDAALFLPLCSGYVFVWKENLLKTKTFETLTLRYNGTQIQNGR